eukprot:3074884-Lingulodinium_polyedra.AAC.1
MEAVDEKRKAVQQQAKDQKKTEMVQQVKVCQKAVAAILRKYSQAMKKSNASTGQPKPSSSEGQATAVQPGITSLAQILNVQGERFDANLGSDFSYLSKGM